MRFTHVVPLLLLAVLLCMPTHGYAQAQKSPYTEVVLIDSDGDKEAIDLVKKLMKDKLDEMHNTNNTAPLVSARFISMGPGQPKTAIIAKITHDWMCGSSGCQIVAFQPTGKNNSYRKILDTTAMRMFFNLRNGQKTYDLLALVGPRNVDGFGVFYWNEKSGSYSFAGISRFKK